MDTIEIVVLHVAECPNVSPLLDDLQHLIGDRHDIALTTKLIESGEQARATGLRGSPTILVNGQDAFPDGPLDESLSCRLYETKHGPRGRPTAAQLEEALDHGPS